MSHDGTCFKRGKGAGNYNRSILIKILGVHLGCVRHDQGSESLRSEVVSEVCIGVDAVMFEAYLGFSFVP